MNQDIKQNIYDLSREDLTDTVNALKQPPYRIDQILEWLYKKYAKSSDDMKNVPGLLRDHLNSNYTFHGIEIEKHIRSNDGFTQKWLFKLLDGSLIETVLMKYDRRATACISTQSGCAMGCTFCATGQMGFGRNLSHSEIIAQVIHAARIMKKSGKRLSNIVFMGMGEPMHNYENVISAKESKIDFVMLGCPHYSLKQLWQVAKLLDGKKVHHDVRLWIFTAEAIKTVAERMGYAKIISEAGGIRYWGKRPFRRYGAVRPICFKRRS